MKITVERKAWVQAIKLLLKQKGSGTLLCTQQIMLEAGGGVLALRATDFDQWLSLEISCQVIEAGKAVIDKRLVRELLSTDGGEVEISSSTSEVIIDGCLTAQPDPNDYPRWPELDHHSDPVCVLKDETLDAIEKVSYAMSRDRTRKTITCVHLSKIEDPKEKHYESPYITATDGHRMSFVEVSPSHRFSKGVSLPDHIVAILGAWRKAGNAVLLEKLIDPKDIDTSTKEKLPRVWYQIQIDGDGPISGATLAWKDDELFTPGEVARQVIPSGRPDEEITVDKKALVGALKSLILLAKNGNGKDNDPVISINAKENKLALLVNKPEAKKLIALAIQEAGEDRVFGINARYLLEAVQAVPRRVAQVTLRLHDGITCTIKTENQIEVIMGVRL